MSTLARSERAEAAGAGATTPLGRAIRVGALLAVVGALLAGKVQLCPFAALTHQPCPGCGLTRASISIARGELAAAFSLHPFAFALTPLLGMAIVLAAVSYVRGGRAALPARFARVFYPACVALFVAMIAFWAARFLGWFGGPVPV